MSPGKRPSRNGRPPGRAASHTSAPIAARATPAKTIVLPRSRIGSIATILSNFVRDSAKLEMLWKACFNGAMKNPRPGLPETGNNIDHRSRKYCSPGLQTRGFFGGELDQLVP